MTEQITKCQLCNKQILKDEIVCLECCKNMIRVDTKYDFPINENLTESIWYSGCQLIWRE